MRTETFKQLIEQAGFPVVAFNEFHFRVDDRLDIYANSRPHRPWVWRQAHGTERGQVEQSRVRHFISDWLRRHPKPEVTIDRDYGISIWLTAVARKAGEPVTLKEKLADLYVYDYFEELWQLVEEAIGVKP